MKSERFILASQWFHCIKVDARVVEESHPYHALFAGKDAPRLVLATWDGGKVQEFLGDRKDKISWNAISKVLDAEYKRNPDRAMKELGKLLSKYDAIDARQKELEAQLERAKEKGRSDKESSIQKKIEELAKEKEEAFALEAKVRDLGLLRELERQKAEEEADRG